TAWRLPSAPARAVRARSVRMCSRSSRWAVRYARSSAAATSTATTRTTTMRATSADTQRLPRPADRLVHPVHPVGDHRPVVLADRLRPARAECGTPLVVGQHGDQGAGERLRVAHGGEFATVTVGQHPPERVEV